MSEFIRGPRGADAALDVDRIAGGDGGAGGDDALDAAAEGVDAPLEVEVELVALEALEVLRVLGLPPL